MSIFFLLVLVSLSIQPTKAQTAIIKDHDGFTNVRTVADIKSEIIDTLANGGWYFHNLVLSKQIILTLCPTRGFLYIKMEVRV